MSRLLTSLHTVSATQASNQRVEIGPLLAATWKEDDGPLLCRFEQIGDSHVYSRLHVEPVFSYCAYPFVNLERTDKDKQNDSV